MFCFTNSVETSKLFINNTFANILCKKASRIDVLIILQQTKSLKTDLILIGLCVYIRVNCSSMGGDKSVFFSLPKLVFVISTQKLKQRKAKP